MERLTKIIDLHNALPLSMVEIETKTNEPCVYGHAVDVLAAYEDTGLTSGQVQRIGNILQNVGEEYNCRFEFVVKCLKENSDLIQQLEAEKNKHIKIQYKYHEYTISQLCRRMDKLEHLLKLAVDDIEGLFVACDSEYNMHNKLTVPGNCKYCKNYSENGCVNDAICKWRYADEAKELIDIV